MADHTGEKSSETLYGRYKLRTGGRGLKKKLLGLGITWRRAYPGYRGKRPSHPLYYSGSTFHVYPLSRPRCTPPPSTLSMMIPRRRPPLQTSRYFSLFYGILVVKAATTMSPTEE
jgi:hypothetical protein